MSHASVPTSQHQSISEVAGAALIHLLNCPSCDAGLASEFNKDREYSWALKLHCGQCSETWRVCTQCSRVNKHMLSQPQASRHHREKHAETADDTAFDVEALDDNSPPLIDSNIRSDFIHRTASLQYFNQCQKGNGIGYLVGKAVFHEDSIPMKLDQADIDTFMHTAHFVSTISRSQREDLASVLHNIVETTKRHNKRAASKPLAKKHKSDTHQFRIEPLTSKQSIRATIIEGKNALFENLAYPEVKTDENHAYILPSEAVADFIAHGLLKWQDRHPDLHPVEGLGQSYMGKAIIADNDQFECHTVFCTIWSDGFDPNYTLANRGSAWILTLCIQPPNVQHVDIHHIYPIIIGKEGDDHSKVLRIIFDDIMSLKRKDGEHTKIMMYDGAVKKNIPISLHLLAVTQDQPERRTFAGLLRGNSNNHRRYGWLVDVSTLNKPIQACPDCQLGMTTHPWNGEWRAPNCDKCCNWLSNPDSITYRVNIENMPDEFAGEQKMKQITYKSLMDCVSAVQDKFINGEWTKNNCIAFLTWFALSEKSRQGIMQCVENQAIYQRAVNEQNEEIINAMNEERQRHPEKYAEWMQPAIWTSTLNIGQSHEATMHLLFLGIVKTICFAIQDWSKLQNKYTSLRKTLEQRTHAIEKVHLSWCKSMVYRGEKLGGWISENFLAFARILPWAYSSLTHLDDDPPYIPPNKPFNKWTAKENTAWLRARRLPRSGNAAELRENVAHHMNLGTPIPEPCGGPVREINDVIFSMWIMVCHIMGMTKSTVSECNHMGRLIRIFLCKVHAYDLSTSKDLERARPLWMSAYNFLCLLNLPEQVQNLGPVRNRWEGSVRGEKFLRQVKPIVGSTRRKKWESNLMTNLLRQRELLLLKQWDGQSATDINESVNDHQADSAALEIYTCYTDLLRVMAEQHPVSCVLTEDSTVWCSYRKNREIYVVPLERHEEKKYASCMWYHEFSVRQETEAQKITSIHVDTYAVLLPLLETVEEENHHYAIVDQRWQTFGEDGHLTLPHMYLQKEFCPT